MVVIEAIACGTPVVATPMGAMSELVDEGVTGFIRSTPADLALAVIAAAEVDRTTCRQVASARFSTARMAQDHLRLYEAIVGHTPARVA